MYVITNQDKDMIHHTQNLERLYIKNAHLREDDGATLWGK